MCGIVGVAGNLTTKIQKAFRDMHIMDVVRGRDSSGVLCVPCSPKEQALWNKAVGTPPDLWEEFPAVYDRTGTIKALQKAIIGHNRAATMGVVNKQNAHPFSHKHICGVHNGSLNDWSELEDYKDLTVDSEALFRTVAVHGIKETWKKFTGPAAIVWWDSNEKTLNFARNKDRPLVYCYDETGKVLFWASEPWMILSAAARHNIKLKEEFTSFEVDKHYKFMPSPTDIGEMEVGDLEPKKSQIHYGNYQNYYGFRSNVFNSKDWIPDKNWKKDTRKAPKSLRNIRFKVNSFFDNHQKAFAVTLDKVKLPGSNTETSRTVQIFFHNKRQHDKFAADHKRGVREYKLSTGRVRIHTSGHHNSFKVLRVPYSCIEIASEDGVDLPNNLVVFEGGNKSRAGQNKFYGFNGQVFLTKTAWEKQFTEVVGGSCNCCWCDVGLTAAQSHTYKFLAKGTALCFDCASDESVVNQVGAMV